MPDQGDPNLIALTECPMQMPTGTPCNECCFSKTSLPGSLGGYSLHDWLNALAMPNLVVACHCSRGFADLTKLDQQRVCTGYAQFRENMGLPATGTIKDAQDLLGKNTAHVFGSFVEFAAHHTQPGAEANWDAYKHSKGAQARAKSKEG